MCAQHRHPVGPDRDYCAQHVFAMNAAGQSTQ
jgi:hypothetical protein